MFFLFTILVVVSSSVLGGPIEIPPLKQDAQLLNNFDVYEISETVQSEAVSQIPRNADPYRLNTTVFPQTYTLTLRLEENFGSTQLFIGNVTIDVTVREDTNLIQLHSKYLTIPEEGVGLFCDGNTTNLFEGLEFGEEYEMLYVTTLDVVQAGSVCVLSFNGFSGVLADDMYGLYRSYYLNENGQTV